jgi:O-antigen/teichoic acid export membrane protein
MYKQEVTVSGFYLAATGIITLITTPILAWYLDPAEIGRYSYYQMLITVGAIFLGGGFAQYLIRTYAESDNPLSKARELISILLILTVATVPLLLVFVTYKLKSLSMAVIIVCASLLITLLEFASHLKRMDKWVYH